MPESESWPDYFQTPLLLGIPEGHRKSRLTGTESTRIRVQVCGSVCASRCNFIKMRCPPREPRRETVSMT